MKYCKNISCNKVLTAENERLLNRKKYCSNYCRLKDWEKRNPRVKLVDK
jgi:hypothetical protein